jgi:DNA gyrase subunit A
MMATRKGLVKKSALTEYSRPRAGGIIGINLEDGDELIDVSLTKPGDEIVLSTRNGMAIRFTESNAREMGRATRGVKGINLTAGDELVGMVVADPDGYLLTICENGFGKRTPFGPNTDDTVEEVPEEEAVAEEPEATEEPANGEGEEGPVDRSSMKYRRQRRGGKGLKDVRVTEKNGPVIGIAAIRDGDEIMLISRQGMVVRTKVDDIRKVGRNTQGVRVMNPNEGDKLATVAKVARETVQAPQ